MIIKNPVLFFHLCKVGLLSLTLCSTCSDAATTYDHGRVHMQGKIVDSACDVATESRDQTIDMLTHPISEILSEGTSLERPFSILLENCSLDRATTDPHAAGDWRYFQVTFDGARDGKNFAVDGDAEGVALQLRDEEGRVAIPGQAMPAGNVQPGAIRLKYTLRLIGNGHDLQAGAYHTTIRYRLDYY